MIFSAKHQSIQRQHHSTERKPTKNMAITSLSTTSYHKYGLTLI